MQHEHIKNTLTHSHAVLVT